MTPQEQELVDELFDRLAKLENTPRDPDAERLVADGMRRAPHAAYALVQTALVMDEALKRANARIEELQAQSGGEEQQQQGGFLDNMRDAVLGRRDPRFGADGALARDAVCIRTAAIPIADGISAADATALSHRTGLRHRRIVSRHGCVDGSRHDRRWAAARRYPFDVRPSRERRRARTKRIRKLRRPTRTVERQCGRQRSGARRRDRQYRPWRRRREASG